MAFKAGQRLSATDYNNAFPNMVQGEASAGSTITVTTTAADVPGASVSVTAAAGAVLTIVGMFDIQANGTTDIFRGLLSIDGAVSSREAHFRGNGETTIMMIWQGTVLATGTHELKLQVQKTNNANTVSVFVPSLGYTRLSVFGPGISTATEKFPDEKISARKLRGLTMNAISSKMSTSSMTASGTVTDVVGAAVEFTTVDTTQQITAIGVFDVNSTGTTDIFTGGWRLDNTLLTETVFKRIATEATMCILVTFAVTEPGRHKLQLAIQKANATDTVTVYDDGTKVALMGGGLA